MTNKNSTSHYFSAITFRDKNYVRRLCRLGGALGALRRVVLSLGISKTCWACFLWLFEPTNRHGGMGSGGGVGLFSSRFVGCMVGYMFCFSVGPYLNWTCVGVPIDMLP